MSQNYIKQGMTSNNPQRQLKVSKDDYKQHSLKQSAVRSTYSANESAQQMIQYFKHYEGNPEYINMPKLHTSLNLKLKKYKQSVYYGQFINGKRHGQGIMIYHHNNSSSEKDKNMQLNNSYQQDNNSLNNTLNQSNFHNISSNINTQSNINNYRKYQGQWQNDFKHGKGVESFTNGCVYQGFYVNGKPEGIGRYSWPNGEFYQGQWLNGMKHGSGMWKGAKGDSYVGEWKFGKADGYGVHTWMNGDRYQGEFKECLKHGEGLERFGNGDIYKGFYAHGKPSGFGQYYWANASYFKGTFKNGLRNGQGIWKKGPGNSDKYEGQYINDKKSGYGIFSWASGNIYKGNYENQSRNGYGQMYWTDGSFYRGQWVNGIQHGLGQIYIPGQGIKRGVFQNNTLIHIQQQYANYNQIPTKYQNQNSKSISQKSVQSNHNKTRQTFRTRAFSTNNRNSQQNTKSVKNDKNDSQTRIFKLSALKTNKIGKAFGLSPDQNLRSGTPQRSHVIRFGAKSNIGKPQNASSGDQSLQGKKQRIMHSAFYMHKLHNQQQRTIKNNLRTVGQKDHRSLHY